MVIHAGYHGGAEENYSTLGGRQREAKWKVWEESEGNKGKFLLAATTLGTIVK